MSPGHEALASRLEMNYAKSIDQMLNLLRVLDCEVDLVVVQARPA